MNKSDLIHRIGEELDLPRVTSETYLNAVLNQITKALAAGESVVLAGFGTFEVRKRAARSGRNPQTGATIEIAASSAPAFKPGAVLKKSVAGA